MKILLKDAMEMFSGDLLPVLAYTDIQLQVFIRENELPRDRVIRIRSHWHMKGFRPADLPLVTLPEAGLGTEHFYDVRRRWEQYGGVIVEISDQHVEGRIPVGVSV